MMCHGGSGSLGAVGLVTHSSDPRGWYPNPNPNPNLFATRARGWVWIRREEHTRYEKMCPGEQAASGGYAQGPMLVLSQSAEVSTLRSHLFPAKPRCRRTHPGSRQRMPQFGDSCGEGTA